MERPVRRTDLEAELARARAHAAGETAGLFGPDSMIWRVDRESALFLGAGRALLLQLAHPWVAAAIAEHSRALADPIGRFHGTFEIMFTLVFGSLEQALDAARRLHRRHAGVRGLLPESVGRFAAGSAYSANEANAQQWVHATLVETALIAHDLVLPPLTGAERERYYAETRLLGAMFGLAPEDQPPDWQAFASYNEAMWQSDMLAVGPAARAIAGQVLAGAGSWLRPPGWLDALTARLLPDPVRRGFGLDYGEEERRRSDRALRWLRRIYPVLPGRIRYVGPYQEACARLAGRSRPDRVTRGLNRLWIGQPAMAPPHRRRPGRGEAR
jgi:uncharacterized protein (DUF2236 family)